MLLACSADAPPAGDALIFMKPSTCTHEGQRASGLEAAATPGWSHFLVTHLYTLTVCKRFDICSFTPHTSLTGNVTEESNVDSLNLLLSCG